MRRLTLHSFFVTISPKTQRISIHNHHIRRFGSVWLFPKLKRPLRGHRFDTIEEIQAESKKALKAIPEIEFNKCLDDWK